MGASYGPGSGRVNAALASDLGAPGPVSSRQMYVVIMAGGGGTRLWPLSSPERPKPFIPLLGEETLFQRTVRRLLEGDELGLGPGDIVVVTDRRYGSFVRDQAPGVAVLEEPAGRNTAAAIALAAVAIDRPAEEVMAVLPADHLIADEERFRAVLRAAARAARGGLGIGSPLVTVGVRADRPATEYGYLRPILERAEQVDGLRAHPLAAFEEKPTVERARELLAIPGVAWNAGIFLWRRRAITAALAGHAPDILGAVASGHAAGTLASVYPDIRATSIDYAVMEPAAAAGQVVMVALDVGWSDIGSWTALLAALGVTGTGRVVQAGEPVEAGANDLVVRRVGGRLRVEAGPARGILDGNGPSALLAGARPGRAIVEALVERVAAREAEQL